MAGRAPTFGLPLTVEPRGSPWITDPLFRADDAGYAFYHNDHLGAPVYLTDLSGKVVWAADYSAFGDAVVLPASTVTNNLRFPGQYYDAETGLHYNYLRDYDPTLGRYLEADPFGIIGNRGNVQRQINARCPLPQNTIQSNLYTYADDNPLNRVDPHGAVVVNPGFGGGFCFPVGLVVGVGFAVSYAYDACCDESGRLKRVHMVTICLGVCSVGSTPSGSGGAGGSVGGIGSCPTGRWGGAKVCGGCNLPGVSCELCVTLTWPPSPSFGCSFGFFPGAGCSASACVSFRI